MCWWFIFTGENKCIVSSGETRANGEKVHTFKMEASAWMYFIAVRNRSVCLIPAEFACFVFSPSIFKITWHWSLGHVYYFFFIFKRVCMKCMWPSVGNNKTQFAPESPSSQISLLKYSIPSSNSLTVFSHVMHNRTTTFHHNSQHVACLMHHQQVQWAVWVTCHRPARVPWLVPATAIIKQIWLLTICLKIWMIVNCTHCSGQVARSKHVASWEIIRYAIE